MFFRKKRRKKKKRKSFEEKIQSKYLGVDLASLSEDEFSEIAPKVYRSIAFRCGGGFLLLICCFVGLVLCGMYLW